MNDTILNDRQKQMLNILEGKGSLSRLEITKLLSGKKLISRITAIRDLNNLIDQNLIMQAGSARAKVYSLEKTNPLLKFIDIENYFKNDMDNRNAKPSFDNDVFKNLTNLFLNKEIVFWNDSSKEFKFRITNLDKSIYKRELERFVIEFSWKSAQIEGNTYDLL